MNEREYAVPMRDDDRDWVRGYLSLDAATNHPKLQEVTHWVVWEWYDEHGDARVEVVPGVGTHRLGSEGFVLGDAATYYEVIGYLYAEGFPIEDFE